MAKNILITIAFLSFTVCHFASSQELDRAAIRELRDRGLYRAAQKQYVEALARSGLDELTRALLVVDYLQNATIHAKVVEQRSRVSIWSDADKIVERYLMQQATSQFALLVRLQHSMAQITRAELLQFESQVNADEETQAKALQIAKSAIRDIKQLLRDIDSQLRSVSQDSKQARMTPDQLRRLRTKSERQIAEAYITAATCETERSNRNSALNRAIGFLRPLSRLKSDVKLSRESRLAEAKCARLLEDFRASERLLLSIQSETNLRDCDRLAVATEQAKLALAKGLLSKAASFVEGDADATCEAKDVVADYFLTRLIVLLSASQQNEDAALRARTKQTLHQIRSRFPGYWQFRAENLASDYGIGDSSSAKIAALQRKASRLYQEGKVEQAVAALHEAIALSSVTSPIDSLPLEYQLAAILFEQKQFAQVRDRLAEVAMHAKDVPDSSNAHRLAILAAAQLARTADPSDVQTYAQLLEQHLATWNQRESVNQVALWLGKLRQRERSWVAAIEAFSRIDIRSDHFVDGILQMNRCIQSHYDTLPANQRLGFAVEMMARIERLQEQASGVTFRSMNLLRLAQIEISLRQGTTNTTDERHLNGILQDALQTHDEVIISETSRLLIVCLAAQAKYELAQKHIEKLLDDRRVLDQLWSRLNQLPSNRTRRHRRARLELALIEKRLALETDPMKRIDLQLAKSDALTEAGDLEQATTLLNQLHELYPKSFEIRSRLATSLQANGKYEPAIRQWRQIVANSRPGSDPWLQGKLQIARNLAELGDKQKAAELIRLTRALHPDLGGDELKAQFIALLEKCSAKSLSIPQQPDS